MKKILLSIFLCLPFLLSAQPYTIKHLSIREGLSNNHVVSIAQDKRGSLWFATEEGLNKFDGIHASLPIIKKKQPASKASPATN